MFPHFLSFFFFFNDTATTEIYTLSLHDALPISYCFGAYEGTLRDLIHLFKYGRMKPLAKTLAAHMAAALPREDRKSTRLNSSHANISYAVFCLKKKKKKNEASLLSLLFG